MGLKIAIIGDGYVGLVTGACRADFGHTVTCIDKDAFKISGLKRGQIPILEPGLESLVVGNLEDGRLAFRTDLTGPAGDADAVFIAVGTPSRAEMATQTFAMSTRLLARSREPYKDRR